jgi:DNA-binding Lrp family transcriptional regulator
MKIKYEDLKIISILRQNSRESLTKISRLTKIPVSTIFDKIRNKTDNYIKKNTCLINFQNLGFNSRAKVVIKVHPEYRESIKEFLLRCKNLNSIFKINNGYDFLLDVIFKNPKELEYFFENIESEFKIIDKNIYYIIDEIESEKFLSSPESIHLYGLV